MSLVKKSDDDSKLILKSDADESKPKRFVKVLDEETFITKLENIIEKSFFPDLERLKVQKAYLEAVKSNNLDALRELYSKYSKLLTPNTKNVATSSKFIETPNLTTESKKTRDEDAEQPYANEELKSMSIKTNNGADGKDEEVGESLDEFLAKNTSEDNVSFEMLIKDAATKQRIKPHQAWLFEKEEKYRQLKEAEGSNKLMIEEGGDEVDPKKSDDITKALDTWTYTSKNSLMFVPDGVALTPEEELIRAKSVRKINHANTRINAREVFANAIGGAKKAEMSIDTKNQKPGQIINKISKIGVDGKETEVKETPKIGGYSLVTMTPSPMPGRSLGDESPAMVWGEIESTPFRLDPSMTPYTDSGPEFKMPSVPEREKIALNLEEKASNERRKRKDEAMRHFQRVLMPSPRVHVTPGSASSVASPSYSDRLSSMSPAARRLLEAKLNIKGSGTATAAAGSMSTPSPLISSTTAKFSLASPSPRVASAAISSSSSSFKSPSVKISSQSIENLKSTLKRPYSSVASSDSLTDDLLKLPKNT